MQDPKRLMRDFIAFWKRVKRKLKQHTLEYIAVAEPQERGAWHLHVMVKSDQPILFMDEATYNKAWCEVIGGGGSFDAERLKSDDMGLYYIAYFTDLTTERPIDTSNDEPNQEMSKARKKGMRLHLYPKGMRFYRCSDGIVEPSVSEEVYGDVLKEFGAPVYTTTYELIKDGEHGEEVLNRIQKETFKKVDKPKPKAKPSKKRCQQTVE